MSRTDRMGFDNLNLLAFRLIILTLPAQYTFEIWNGTHATVPPGIMIAVIGIAIFSIITDARLRLKICLNKVEIFALLWFFVLGGIIIALTEKTTTWPAEITSFNSGFFVGIIGTIIVRLSWARCAVSRLPLSFVGALVTPYLFIMIPFDLLEQGVQNLPLVYDGPLYRITGILWAGGTSWLADLLRRNSTLDVLELDLYNYVVIWSAIAALWQQSRRPASRCYLLLSFVPLQLAGYGFYGLMPGIGPSAFFGHLFPDALPSLQSVPAGPIAFAGGGPRNAMPSLHASVVILCFLALRECPVWQRSVGGFMIVNIIFSTLGFGKHYAVDWVGAFPLVLFVRAAAAVYLPVFDQARRNALAAGFLLEAFWVVAIRAAPYSLAFPNVIRALALVSLIAPVLLERQLARAEQLPGFEPVSDRARQMPGCVPQESG